MTGFHPVENYQCIGHRAFDVQISVKALAGCGPSEERKRTLPEMEFPARNADMLHNKTRKSKGENFFILLIFTARNDAYEVSVFRAVKDAPEHGFH